MQQHTQGARPSVDVSEPAPELRASDQDRQKVADRLRAAVDEGRLDLNEYDERLAAGYAAKTYGELAALTADLPPPARLVGSATAASDPATVAEQHAEARRWRWSPWRPWLAASAVTTGIWGVSSVANGELIDFWPVWVIVPWGIVLGMRSLGGGPRHYRRGC